MNYDEIGQRIRKIRRERRLSQEELAEQAGISTTHMSHIETGNTKLSLPVFVALARALNVRTDSLLSDEPRDDISETMCDIRVLLEGCDARQACIIRDVIRAMKQTLDANLKT